MKVPHISFQDFATAFLLFMFGILVILGTLADRTEDAEAEKDRCNIARLVATFQDDNDMVVESIIRDICEERE